MGADFTGIEAEVARTEGIVPSVVILLTNVADQITAAVEADNLEDNSNTARLATALKAQVDALAEAVANVP